MTNAVHSYVTGLNNSSSYYQPTTNKTFTKN